MRRSVAARELILVVLLLACGRESLQTARRVPTSARGFGSLAGCYALFDRAQRPAEGHLYWAPSFTRLDTAPERRAWKLDAALRAESLDTRAMETREWAVDSLADTVRITFHNGFSGSTFVLGIREGSDTLRGRAIEHWDLGPSETDGGAASAIRIPCGP